MEQFNKFLFFFFFLNYTYKRKIDYIINILNIVLKLFIYILCIIYLNITGIPWKFLFSIHQYMIRSFLLKLVTDKTTISLFKTNTNNGKMTYLIKVKRWNILVITYLTYFQFVTSRKKCIMYENKIKITLILRNHHLFLFIYWNINVKW